MPKEIIIMNRPHLIKILCSIVTLSLTSLVQGESNVSILLPTQLKADAGYDLALKELETVLEKNSYQSTIHYLKIDEPLPDGNRIVVGDFGDSFLGIFLGVLEFLGIILEILVGGFFTCAKGVFWGEHT